MHPHHAYDGSDAGQVCPPTTVALTRAPLLESRSYYGEFCVAITPEVRCYHVLTVRTRVARSTNSGSG